MSRFTLTVLLAFAAVSAAHAEDTKILKIDPASKAARPQIVAAAEDVCRRARAHDPFDDFGSLDECVENTLQSIEIRQHAGDTGTQVSSAR
jgi:hypothetical protein